MIGSIVAGNGDDQGIKEGGGHATRILQIARIAVEFGRLGSLGTHGDVIGRTAITDHRVDVVVDGEGRVSINAGDTPEIGGYIGSGLNIRYGNIAHVRLIVDRFLKQRQQRGRTAILLDQSGIGEIGIRKRFAVAAVTGGTVLLKSCLAGRRRSDRPPAGGIHILKGAERCHQ